jgi:enoyl-CoA hydratase/carnithine racemase
MTDYDHVVISIKERIATLTIDRPKVNALNEVLIQRLSAKLSDLKNDPNVDGVIIIGKGKFFSFGFDVPELYSYSREAFSNFIQNFCNLYASMFVFPKPLVAAINGHAAAGGCMLALACDYRIMASGHGKIGLNEMSFGATALAGATEMLRFLVGNQIASEMLISGYLYNPDEAMSLKLVQEVVDSGLLLERSNRYISNLIDKDVAAFRATKDLLRLETAKLIRRLEADSIVQFVDIWYSEPTRTRLRGIIIR